MRLSILPRRRQPEARSRRFEYDLDQQAAARHARIREQTPSPSGRPLLPPMPFGFRAGDALGWSDREGYLPLAMAAEAMGYTEADVEAMAAEGLLEATWDGGLYVRPALVSVLHVRQP